MPRPIDQKQRKRLERLIEKGDGDKARSLLTEWVHQYELTPWALDWLGRMHLARGERVLAGWAFFWAGTREGDGVSEAIDAFLRRTPRQVLATLGRQARVPFAQLPANLQADLRTFDIDPEKMARILTPRRSAGGWWLVVRSLLCLLGVVTFLRALFTWLQDLAPWFGR